MAHVLSVNIGSPRPDRGKPGNLTGIGKVPVPGAEVRAPGPRGNTPDGPSGLVGDFVGDLKHHGGDEQAVYAYAREDLDHFAGLLGTSLSPGQFGENLTTVGLDVTGARIGERWRIGVGEDAAELVVTVPRIPCNTFRAWMDVRGWLKTFTRERRPGTYLAVAKPGVVRAGDPIEVVFTPPHEVSVAMAFGAVTNERDLADAVLAAREYLGTETVEMCERREVFKLG